MKFRTKIPVQDYPFAISYTDPVFLMGSCFSDNIGTKLHRSKFRVLSNPMGIVYNPLSIARQIEFIIDPKKLKESGLYSNDELWHHFDFHGKFSSPDKLKVLETIQEQLTQSALFLKKSKYLFITFGTANVFYKKDINQVVANNHKFPIELFEKKRLKIDVMLGEFNKILKKLSLFNPDLKVVFTISPVRYIRDGLVENQRSKSSLFMLVDELEKNERAYYFPSFEIFIDDLRDYRFYGEDLLHPADSGLEYTWKQFKESFFDEKTIKVEKEVMQVVKASEHRPIHSESESHKKFRSGLLEKCKAFIYRYPFIDLSEEVDSIKNQK